MNYETKMIPLASILISARIRKDTGDIRELAADLEKHGMLNPITVMDAQNGQYQLIAGLRRMEAVKSLGNADIRCTVVSPMEADEIVSMEISENEQRLNFTLAERLECAEKIKAIEQAKGRERMALGGKGGISPRMEGVPNWAHLKTKADSEHAKECVSMALCGEERDSESEAVGNCPHLQEKTRDIVAKKAGFGSHTQYGRIVKIANERPDLLPKIDAGETTIYAAYQETVGKCDEKSQENVTDSETEARQSRCEEEGRNQPSGKRSDQVARAGTERLMKNPNYRAKCDELVNMTQQACVAETALKRAQDVFKNQMANSQSIITHLKLLNGKLKEENKELRKRLGMEEVDDTPENRGFYDNPDGIIGSVICVGKDLVYK